MLRGRGGRPVKLTRTTLHNRATRAPSPDGQPSNRSEDEAMEDVIPSTEDIKEEEELHPQRSHAIPYRSTPAPNTTTSQDSLQILGAETEILLDTINDLFRQGIDANIPLPKIVVIGDQSAGKSSLIEAISEISLPREAGTCTRCPLQIQLHNAATAWECKISLTKRYAWSPTSSKTSPLHPWVEFENATITPFVKIRDKSKLEQGIRSAQIATLNPKEKDIKKFIDATELTHGIDVPFSPNVITLDIYAPGLLNLSFYDLPGVISQTPDGNRDTVKLIEALNLEYIKQENTIVLLTIPMESDIDNSKASALLRQAEASYRTVGVLTKPDRLQSDDRVDGWKAVLQDKAFRMGHGYFVVKQLSQSELANNLGHVDARLAEKHFFNSEQWTGRFGHDFADRLGTPNLQLALSKKLAQLIFTVMPSLQKKVGDKLTAVNKELNELPEPPTNGLQVVNATISEFKDQFKIMIEANNPNDLSNTWQHIKKTFQVEIVKAQRPKLQLDHNKVDGNSVGKAQLSTPSKRRLYVDLSSDNDSPFTTPTKGKRKNVAGTPTLAKAARIDTVREQSMKREDSDSDMMPTPAKSKATQIGKKNSLCKSFSLLEIRKAVQAYSTFRLPGDVEPKAVDHLILATLVNWHLPLAQLFDSLYVVLDSALRKTLNVVVSEWRTTQLYQEMSTAITQFLAKQLAHTRDIIAARVLRVECFKPITKAEDLSESYREAEQVTLTKARLEWRVSNSISPIGDDEPRPSDAKKKKAREELPPDPFSREIGVMARIRAYYQIASMRFIDQIIQAVEAELFLELRDHLGDHLSTALKVHEETGFANANRLIADDPEREQRRVVLKEQKERLEQAGQRIKEMNRTFEERNIAAAGV